MARTQVRFYGESVTTPNQDSGQIRPCGFVRLLSDILVDRKYACAVLLRGKEFYGNMEESTKTSTLPDKKVKLDLAGLDGNAFSPMAAFSRQARREKWTKEEIESVMKECRSGNYDHLLQTLMKVTQ